MSLTTSVDERVPVLIVGGGGAGLTASMLLAAQGVEHLLVSARPTHVGPAEGARAQPAGDGGARRRRRRRGDRRSAARPPSRWRPRRSTPGFAGPDADYGRRLAKLESWGAGGADESWRAASAVAAAQPPADPPRAAAEGPRRGALAGSHPLQPRARRARAGRRGRPRDGPRQRLGRGVPGAQRVPARRRRRAAGRRPRRRGVRGPRRDHAEATLHVTADFSPLAKDPDVLIRWIFSPQAGVLVVMVPMGPERWGPDSEEWVIHLNYPVDDTGAVRRAGRGRRPRGARASATYRWRSTRSRAGRWRRCSRRRSRSGECSCSATRRTATRPPAASG